MKRSEMSNHIEEELNEFLKSLEHIGIKAKPYMFKQYANKILDMMEGFGMLPPGVMTDILCRQDNAYYIENEWEPEDEQ